MSRWRGSAPIGRPQSHHPAKAAGGYYERRGIGVWTTSQRTGGQRAGGWNPDHGDRFQRQFAVNAYAANATPDLNASTSPVPTSINV